MTASIQSDNGRPGTYWRTWKVLPSCMVSMRIGRGIAGMSHRRAIKKSDEKAERARGVAWARATLMRTSVLRASRPR